MILYKQFMVKLNLIIVIALMNVKYELIYASPFLFCIFLSLEMVSHWRMYELSSRIEPKSILSSLQAEAGSASNSSQIVLEIQTGHGCGGLFPIVFPQYQIFNSNYLWQLEVVFSNYG